MKFKAHDYQQYAIDFILSHPVCCLILDMGLGKTAITLTAMMELLFNYFLVGKVLVIAPKRVAESTWPAEIKKWEHLTGLTYSVVKGTAKQRNEALLRPADVYIIGRDNVTWLVEKKYFSFDLIVIDELSSFKSPKAQRFKSLRKVRPLASRVIGLTGTPGNPMDLWAEIGILDMGQRLGRFIGAYRERFFVPDKRNGEIIYSYKPRAGAEEQIYELISDISISMKAVDFLNMPECIYNQVKVQMSDTEKSLYERMEADMILQFGEGKDIDAVNAAALNNKLQQMANGAVYNESGEVQLIHDRKLDVLEDLIEAANGKPLLVAYWFKHDRDRIMARFQVRDIDSAKDIEDWNAGKIPVALIHPASAGHGLNLQEGGSTIVWFSQIWSLELYQQLNARLWRQGQKHTVVIEHLVTEGTVDEDILRAIEKKDNTQEAMINAVKARIGDGKDEGRSHDE
jgi:SNF2 family DNA or RNA helicase